MSVVFFTDRDLGTNFPSILAHSGLRVERHGDHFAHDCADEEWLREIGARGWVAITRDERIRYRPNEIAAVKRHRVRLLLIVGKAPHADLAANFVAMAVTITMFLERHAGPLIAKVHRPSPGELARRPQARGRITLWYPGGDSPAARRRTHRD